MLATPTAIPEIIVLEPKVFNDERGLFFESFNQNRFNSIIGREVDFVQDNESFSKQAVLRSLHYQIIRPQGKLTRVSEDEIFNESQCDQVSFR